MPSCLFQCLIVEEPSSEPKENNPANLVSLRTQSASLRDQIYRIDKEEAGKVGGHSASVRKSSTSSQQQQQQPQHMGSSPPPSKASEKFRKKLVELEAQLSLASPSLLFQVRY